jgi:MraZ protein
MTETTCIEHEARALAEPNDVSWSLHAHEGFRNEILRHGEHPPILTNLQHCVALYPYETWLEVERQLSEASSMQPEVQALQRFMVSGATESPIDGQGRILVPPYLREHGALDRDVTIAGVGKRIELWDSARLKKDLERTSERLGEISAAAQRFLL